MAFVEAPRFPDTIAYGAVGGPEWSTDIIMSQGGHEQRNRNWAHARAKYQVGQVNRSRSETQDLIAFFRAVAFGRFNAFRFKDYTDYTFTNVPLGTGNAVATQFQLLKRYTLGAYSLDRPLYKPVSGTVTCALNGTPTAGFTVSLTTGMVTFSSAPGNGVVITASGEFDTPVRFDTDWMNIQPHAPDAYSWPSIELLEVRDIA